MLAEGTPVDGKPLVVGKKGAVAEQRIEVAGCEGRGTAPK